MFDTQGILDSEWKMSHFNQGFQAIPSYPETLVFPASVTDQVRAGSIETKSPFLSQTNKR